MATRLSIAQWTIVAIAASIGGFLLGVVGLIIGADFGGNFCNTCEFNGLRGYEATGQLGFILGACIGVGLCGWAVSVLLHRRNAKRTTTRSVLAGDAERVLGAVGQGPKPE